VNLFTIISNIELYPNHGFKLIRSAGLKAIITKKDGDKVNIKLKSG